MKREMAQRKMRKDLLQKRKLQRHQKIMMINQIECDILWPIPFTHDLYKLFYQKSFTIAGFHKMPLRQGSKIETMKILLEDQFLIGFHLVVILRILFICTKRKLNVFFFSNLNLNPWADVHLLAFRVTKIITWYTSNYMIWNNIVLSCRSHPHWLIWVQSPHQYGGRWQLVVWGR